MNAAERAVLRADLVHRDHGAGARARTAHLRSRRRCLRHRRRPRRAHHRARDRAPRLVGRGAGEPPHRLERVRPQRRLRAARLCRRHGPDRQPRRLGSRQGAVGAVRDGSQIRAHHHRRGAHAGRRPDGRLAQGVQGRQRRRGPGRPRSSTARSSAPRSRAGRPSACATVLKTDHYFHALHLPRAFHIHPLNYALGLAEAAEAAGARIFEDTPALSIDVEGVRKRIVTPSGARARRPYRARLQRPSRRAGAAHRRHADCRSGAM